MIIYTSVAVFLFFAIALVIPSGFSVGAVLLLAGSIVLLRKHAKIKLQREEIILISVLALYFLAGSFANLVHGAPIREYDSPMRFMLAIPVLLLLRVFPPIPRFFWGGVATGAIASGLFAAWQFFFEGGMRADGFTNPIQFGNIGILLGILCLPGLGWAASQRRSAFWLILLSGGIFLGLLGSLFSESRGSWISLPVALLVAYQCYGEALHKRHIAASLAVMLVLFGVLYVMPRTPMEVRVRLSIAETQDYFKSGNTMTSAGTRLEMWRTGLLLFPERPWLGWGKEGYMKEAARLTQAGKVRPTDDVHSHLHNEYLDALVKRGVLGLAALLILYLVPLALFVKRIRSENHAVRPYAVAGALLSVCYICFGLTQAFLTHNNGVMIFAFTLVILWSLLREQESNGAAYNSVNGTHRDAP
ncbi:MAG: O-antigen ligase family protein [Glaciimonas sp.]|nr:O-antigen ligase family protein [Glaciimonas sp.]